MPARKTKTGLGTRLAAARSYADLTQSGLGKELGVNRSAVSQWEKEHTDPAAKNLRAVAELTGVNFEWLATGRGDMLFDDGLSSEDVAAGAGNKGRTLKVKGYVGANGQTGFYAVNQSDLTQIEASESDPPNAVAVEIMGDSLGPLLDRWYAIYNDVRSPVTDDMINKLCVVGLDDDRVLIKLIKRNGTRFDLHSNNDKEKPIQNVRIKWAAKVIAVRQK